MPQPSVVVRFGFVLVLCLLTGPRQTLAQNPTVLVDRETFFANPEMDNEQISPNGDYTAFLKPWHGVQNIWVKRTSEPFSSARLLTSETKWPVYGFFWGQDSKYILYQQDHDGDLSHNVFAVSPTAPASDGAAAPTSRNLTQAHSGHVLVYVCPTNEPDVLYFGTNERDENWFDIYEVHISTGEKMLFRKNTDRIFAWKFDSEGQLRMAGRNADNGDRELLRVDRDGYTKVYSCKVTENCWPYRFDGTGRRAYLWTSKGDRSVIELVLLDLEHGESAGTELVAADPLQRVGPGKFVFSDTKNKLLAAEYEDDHQRYYFQDKQFERDFRWLQRRLPAKEIVFGTRTNDERIWIVKTSADTEPGETYLFDRGTHKLTFQYRILENLPRSALSQMKPVLYPSSDGLEIPGFLTLPKGVKPQALPLVVIPHGGPWSRVWWAYDAWAQFLCNRGYAVLQPNFRGSEGFGKAFKNAGDRERGRKMQDDITWGVKYLVAQGVVDPKRVGIFGISYGGYAALAGVTFTPGVYAAAVDLNGTSNLIHLLQSQPATSIDEYRARVGDPSTEQGRQRLNEVSPSLHANQIETPLLIVQGVNESDQQRTDAEQIVVTLRDGSVPVEYLLVSDEGHVFTREVDNMATFMAVEQFFTKYLGGRCQPGAKPEVAARLAAIKVDVSSLPKKPSETGASSNVQ